LLLSVGRGQLDIADNRGGEMNDWDFEEDNAMACW
jgi:hypothetical protein